MKSQWNIFHLRKQIAFFMAFLIGGLEVRLAAAEIDESQLPPPAAIQTEFARDIKPIFDASCIRCHGPEKPKSGFRLDNREAALKGGENGVDLVPGNSAKSRLIHYVTRLVPDLEMPPEGKGEPLTTNQIALLRAWIDQGAAWDSTGQSNLYDLSISPGFGWTFVSGDKHTFRAQNWQRDGFEAGLESFEFFNQPDSDTRESITGHALLNDYKTVLELNRNQLGFIHSGWEQYRKYYDDTGGYFPPPATEAPQSLGTDLHLDIGRVWVDFGLTLPRWPRMVLGYEYDYRLGDEAITSWQSTGVPGEVRNIAPATKSISEGTHVIKFDLEAEVRGVTIEDRFRGEFYKLNTAYTNVAARDAVSQNASEANSYFQGANSIRLEKKFKNWLFGSAGYFYSKLNADDIFTNVTVSSGTMYVADVPNLVLERESHVFNINALLGALYGFTLSAGVQSEWTQQQGLGSGNLNGIAFTLRPGTLMVNPATVSSDYQQNTISESVGIRYTKIPFTSLFADARFHQETISQSDMALQQEPGVSFLENPSFTSQLSDFRTGFNTSPWRNVSWSAHYRRYEDDSHYKTNQVPQPVGGYPGFLSSRNLLTDEVETKLVLRPSSWMKTTLSYQIRTTHYEQETRAAFAGDPPTFYSPGGLIEAGKDEAHIYGLGMTFIPYRRLYLSTTFSYQDTTTSTANPGSIPPYKGDIYSLLVSGTYILSQSTDLLLNYSLSLADYTQSDPGDATSPPPLGIRYQLHALQLALAHRFSKNLSTRFQYGYFYYDEPQALGVNNYRAHSIFASLTYHFR